MCTRRRSSWLGNYRPTRAANKGLQSGQGSQQVSSPPIDRSSTLNVVGVALVGGRGERARPITLKAPGYLRSKAAISFCGRRVIWWLLKAMRAQGISQFLVVARGKENRYQTKMSAGFGEEFGASIRYSPVRFDTLNTGSADAALRDLDYWGIDDPVLVFPTDSLFEFSLQDMFGFHEARGATMTVATMARTPAEVVGKYGVMRSAPDGRVTAFVEKPSRSKLMHPAFGMVRGPEPDREVVWTSAGMYLLDTLRLRKYGQDPEVLAARQWELDFGRDLLPWLIHNDASVFTYPASATGDLGTVDDYLASTVSMLQGGFPSFTHLLGPPIDATRRIWIPPETLQLPDEASGLTLEEKLDQGLVIIDGNVRLGRYVEVGVGARLADSNIDDGVEIGAQARVHGSALRDGARIGESAVLESAYVGTMCDIDSSPGHPTHIGGGVGLGDEVRIEAGIQLLGPLAVPPRAALRAGRRRATES